MCRESLVPKAFGIGDDESARNEISILIAGMTRGVRGKHHMQTWLRYITSIYISTVSVEILLENPVNYFPGQHR
jgi:hypothetical protein